MTATHRCRSCKAEVRFVKHVTSGRTMILDDAPVENGNIQIVPTPAGPRAAVQPAALLAKLRLDEEPLYIDHHATCPYADQHRRNQ